MKFTSTLPLFLGEFRDDTSCSPVVLITHFQKTPLVLLCSVTFLESQDRQCETGKAKSCCIPVAKHSGSSLIIHHMQTLKSRHRLTASQPPLNPQLGAQCRTTEGGGLYQNRGEETCASPRLRYGNCFLNFYFDYSPNRVAHNMAFTSQRSFLCPVAFAFCLLWTSLLPTEVLPPLTCLPCSPGVQLSTGCLFLVTAPFRTLSIVFPLTVPKVLRLTLLPGKLSWLNPMVVKIG